MRSESRRRAWRLAAPLATFVLATACTAGPVPPSESSTDAAPTSTQEPATVAAPPPATAPPRTVNWFDLDVGDCLADPAPTDPYVITVALVDCATAHQAEVYRRSPLAVNTALADVADRECSAGFAEYTGQQPGSSTFSTVYLIDSNQNRTSANPNPSAVICLLQSADGQPLIGSARR